MVQQRQNDYSGLALITGGIVLVTVSIAGYFIGALIDRRLGTAPTGAIIGLVLGTIFGIWDLYKVASRIINQQPVPTQDQQQAANDRWEKYEKDEKSEGDRGEGRENQ